MLNSIVSVKMKSLIESENTKIQANYYKYTKVAIPEVRGSNLTGSGLKFFSVFSKTDSMSDFILTLIFEFNIKSYVNSVIARS